MLATLDGAVTSWTPSLEDCLEPGRRYGWSLRTVAAEDTESRSAPRFFEVSSAPSVEELGQALDVVQRYLRSRGEGAAPEVEPHPPSRPAAAEPAHPSQTAPDPKISLASVVAAIRGELGATSGETVGVLGISSSPAGYGGYFSNSASGGDGAGLYSVGAAGDEADVVLGANDCTSLGEDGVIRSDPGCSGSDIAVESNDSVVVKLDSDANSTGSFFGVRNPGGPDILKVIKDGTVQVNG